MKLLEFIVASSLLTLMPGPDILFVMAQSIVQGRKTGIAVALGLCSGLFVHTALAALGISLIIASSPILFAAIRFFPQFLDKTSATPRIDILILGTTFAAVAITIFTIVALVADWVSARFGARQVPPATLAWIRAGVYWTIAMLFLFY